jgi:multiple sugar transport system ATP-binding protein
VTALDVLNLTVNDQEFVTLVGPSGCGKSTTLNITAGLEDPSGGELSIDGRLVNAVPPGDRDIAMVFQSYALYPHKTVRDNIGFGLKVRKMPKPEIEKRVQEAATLLGIADLLDRKPRELSGGQRQRLGIARALLTQPQLVVLDEATSSLDGKTEADIGDAIQALRGTTTVVLIAHRLSTVRQADQVIYMENGNVQCTGTFNEVRSLVPNFEIQAKLMGL